MVQSFELRLLLMEDGSIIFQNPHSKHSHTLPKGAALAARELIEDAYPVVRPGNGAVKIPERSVELAKRAPEPASPHNKKYTMEPSLLKRLAALALFDEWLTRDKICTVLELPNKGTLSGVISRLHQNGFLKREAIAEGSRTGKYMVSPQGHAFLDEVGAR